MDMDTLMKSLGGIEQKLTAFEEQAKKEISTVGAMSTETKNAIDAISIKQREFADELLALKQRGVFQAPETNADSWGDQFIKADAYKAFAGGNTQKARLEVKNTVTGSNTTVAPDRKPGVVSGAFQMLTMESLFPHVPTSSNAIEFTKENVFTNNAAEAAEAASKAESSLTFTLVNMPISTVAHWIKISRQLASDHAALAAYIDLRMRYGVNRKVETQLVAGDGTAPNISGILDSGNYTAHGYANADLGSTLKKLVLIRKIMGDLWSAGYPADTILLNPADWAQIEIDIFTASTNMVGFKYDDGGRPILFGIPVVLSVGMTADNVAVGAFNAAGTIYDREGVVVEMSDSDSDNFTKNLITLRAERRLALATERPAAIRAGDLTPA